MAAALLMMTQCRKENATPNVPADGTVKMTVTAGPGRTDINTATGAITWSTGDKLYVSNGAIWLGSLTLVDGAGTANGTFTGSVTGLDDEGDACHFFYLGHDNGMAEPTGGNAASISMATQNGTLAGAMKYHLGYGNTDVTVTEGEATGSVIMNTKIAIAHINFTTDGTSAYTGSVAMGGTGISNTMTVSPDGTFTGSGDGGITIGATTTSEKYVTLIPTTGTDVVCAEFTGDATGSLTFAKGIHENKFYGMSNAMVVTLTPKPKFSVGENTTVEFAPGNLYWDGSAFRFEANQWDYRHYSGKNNDAAVIGGVSQTTPSGTVGSFFWSKTASVAYASSYDYSGTSTTDVFFTNATDFQVSGETAGTWRTLSNAEWSYLLNTRDNASSLRAWKDLDNGAKGLVILPDGTDASVVGSITKTADLATHGAVFLPAAGDRSWTGVYSVGSGGYYWSGTPYEGNKDEAYFMNFSSDSALTLDNSRNYGYSVRLVR